MHFACAVGKIWPSSMAFVLSSEVVLLSQVAHFEFKTMFTLLKFYFVRLYATDARVIMEVLLYKQVVQINIVCLWNHRKVITNVACPAVRVLINKWLHLLIPMLKVLQNV